MYLIRYISRVKEWEVLEYISPAGNSPFQNWLKCLKDVKGRALNKKENQFTKVRLFLRLSFNRGSFI